MKQNEGESSGQARQTKITAANKQASKQNTRWSPSLLYHTTFIVESPRNLTEFGSDGPCLGHLTQNMNNKNYVHRNANNVVIYVTMCRMMCIRSSITVGLAELSAKIDAFTVGTSAWKSDFECHLSTTGVTACEHLFFLS